MRIIVELPKPPRAVVVDANAHVTNELAGVGVTGFEDTIKGDAIIGV
jgi:hypothetical protein